MGILGLRDLLKKEAPGCIQTKELEDYRGQKVAIDANIALFAFLATDLGNLKSKGRPTGHVYGFLQRTAKFLTFEINPIYIFDGKTLGIKHPELLRRRVEKYGSEKLSDFWPRDSSAPDEGEALCCHLSNTNQVNAVASEDSDCLAYGAKKVLMSFKATTPKEVSEYDQERMLQGLGLSKESFIDFCILDGCDYCNRIDGLNAEKALELIREFKTIDAVLENIDREKYPISERWLSQYPKARLQFIEPNVTVIADDELKTKTIDYENLESYLVTALDFSETRVKDALNKIQNTIMLSPKKPNSTKRSMQSTSSTNRRKRHNTGGNTKSTQISTISRKLTEYFKPVEKGTGEGESSKRSEP